MLLGAPLVLIAVSWLPAMLLSVGQYYRALYVPGTASFHAGMVNQFRQSLVMVGLLTGAAAAWAGYLIITVHPASTRDRVTWLFGVAILAWYFGTVSFQGMNADGILLFRTVPLVVGVLSVVGACLSWLSAGSDRTIG